MIEYSLNGALGKNIPDEKLINALSDFGVGLKVEIRRDGLSNVKISIDDEKILQVKKYSNPKDKSARESKETVKKTSAKKTNAKKTTK